MRGMDTKKPLLQWLIVGFAPVGASLCQTQYHSHSIVAGGLLVQS